MAIRTERVAIGATALATPLALYVLGLATRVMALLFVGFPFNEGSAYYVAVARSLVSGQGLTINAIWSYATPPLALPRQAFELWQPLASLVAALPMRVLGPTFTSAQLGFALFGALLAPLAWLIARDAARRLDLPANRASAVAVGTGVLVAVAGPFLLSAALPDSTLPFTVLAVAGCAVMPAAARGERRALIGLGLLAGLAYLTRMEAIYLVVAFIAVARGTGVGWSPLLRRGLVVAGVGALLAAPWWLRNLFVFGTPLPGQLADNAFLVNNQQIFSFADRPTLDGFLAQGPALIVSNIASAGWHNLAEVLLVPGAAMATVGGLTLIFGWRRRHAIAGSPLAGLLIYGAFAFVISTLVFPVATLWGTFEHASGPLMVALAILSVLGADAFVARVRTFRGWVRPNAWLAPGALLALTLPIAFVQLAAAGMQASEHARQVAAVGAVVRAELPMAQDAPILTDRPIWLSDELHVPALALPDEPPSTFTTLADRFGARYIVLLDGPGRYQSALSAQSAGCVSQLPVPLGPAAPDLAIFEISGACR